MLAGAWSGPEPLDLSRALAIVPTRQSGRRLREALASYAADRQAAAFPPRVLTPEALIGSFVPPGSPSKVDRLLSWVRIFREVDLSEYREVFPIDPPGRDFVWALRLAERFCRLQSTLAENRLRIGDVADRAGDGFPELERWRQLGALEQLQLAQLATAGMAATDAGAAPRRAPAWWSEVERVVIIGTPDPLPAALGLLDEECGARTIDLLVFAPDEECALFDAWGRPNAADWATRVLELPDFENRVRVCVDPGDQASRIVALASDYQRRATSPGAGASASADGLLALGIADPDVVPVLESEAAHAGVAVFNPEGAPRAGCALSHLLGALAALVRTPGIESVEALARCPEVLAYLGERCAGFSAARFLAGLDDLRRRHLPGDLAAARSHATGALAAALAEIGALREALGNADFPRNLAAVLGAIFAGGLPELTDGDAGRLREDARAWTETVCECAAAAERFGGLAPSEAWELALRIFGESLGTGEKPADAYELQGWLELLFEDAPHLVIAGLNDGFVPEAVSEDPFLPESLRSRLGLKTNAGRFARDAYLLQALAASRAGVGRLDLLVGRTSAEGDPLRPSRLLLRCADEQLPARIAFLFRNPEPVGSHLPWRRAWLLSPRVVAPPEQVAVTALRRWLACPFRFYLKSVLRMEPVDPAKTEMDAFDFGTLCHAALEAMGKDPALRDCTDPAALREFLLSELARDVRGQFGSDLPVPVLIQVESARQRLSRFAEVQAAERAAGWVIQVVEKSFAIPVAGLVIKGKIDRIDRNENSGAIRVLDYKTSDAAVTPMSAHLRFMRDPGSMPEWALVELDGRLRAWTDLQLPLYRHALAAEWGDAIGCGYVNLPKAVGETALSLWGDGSLELQQSAMRCAEGVCSAIRAARFWPPNEDVRAESDEFAALFHQGVAASIDAAEWSRAIEAKAAGTRDTAVSAKVEGAAP